MSSFSRRHRRNVHARDSTSLNPSPVSPPSVGPSDVAQSNSPTPTNPVLVIGLILLAVCILVILVGIIWRRYKTRRNAKQSKDVANEKGIASKGFTRAKLTASIVLPRMGEPPNAASLAMAPSPSKTHLLEEEATLNFVEYPHGLTEAEKYIYDYHQANNELPAPFAAFVTDADGHRRAEAVDDGAQSLTLHGSTLDNQHSRQASTISSVSIKVSIGRTGDEAGSRVSLGFNSANLSSSEPANARGAFEVSGKQSSQSGKISRPGTGNSASFLSPPSSPNAGQTAFRFPSQPNTLPQHQRNAPSTASASSSFSAMLLQAVVESSSAAKNSSSTKRRKVLQEFEPLLPDELRVVKGDKLFVMQEFDDGWCVVACEPPSSTSGGSKRPGTGNSARSRTRSRPGTANSARSTTDGNGVEMGCVPLWVFDRRTFAIPERRVRSSSLAITVEISAPAPRPLGTFVREGGADWERQAVVSWSNF